MNGRAAMPADEVSLLSIDRGSVTSPAGCGKTHLIASALRSHAGQKPILILTHTNAGVAALRGRLNDQNISPKNYRLSTIDGWAMRLISTFPGRSEHDVRILNLLTPGSDYPAIRVAAVKLLSAGHIQDVLAATYDRLFVDEYQDCSIQQHEIVSHTSETLKTCVLGDPMQAIFGFRGNQLVDWAGDVVTRFPSSGVLATPWRWINAEAEELGRWLLDVRTALARGESIDLARAPAAVSWIRLSGNDQDERSIRLEACRTQSTDPNVRVLIIGDSRKPDGQLQYACQTPGAIAVEAVDLKGLISFARDFVLSDIDALQRLIMFAGSVMTQVNASSLINRIDVLARGRSRSPATPVEAAALSFKQSPSFVAAIAFLVAAEAIAMSRTFRPAVLKACMKSLQFCANDASLTFLDACIRTREQYRAFGRPLPKRGVGSTLLLKGLEADSVVILDPSTMDSNNLYVAMTRGSRSLTICSSTSILNPTSER